MAKKPKVQAPKTASSKTGGPSRALVGWLAIAALVAVGLIAASVLLSRGGDDEGGTTTAPLTESALEGIPQTGSMLGSEDAGVTLIEYADLACPFCKAYAIEIFPSVVDEYIRPGDVKTDFRGLAFVGPSSERALRAVYAAGLQDKLWFMVEALYAAQGDELTDWATEELIRELASGIDGLDVDKMFEDMDSTAVDKLIATANDQAQAAEVGGTPWFMIQVGDDEPYHIAPRTVEEFREAIDDAIAE